MQINKQEKSPIKQRILQYIEYKCITKYRFYKESGITRNILDQQTGISEDNISLFLAYAQDISPMWLLLGEGKMLKSDFSAEAKKNEHQDKKKCHDTQNNFNEKNVSPINEFHDNKNVSPLIENISPICKPNPETDTQSPFFSMASDECELYQKAETITKRKRDSIEGVNVERIMELKDDVIDAQKSHINSLEAQLKDFRRDNEILRRDVLELKKDVGDIKKENMELNQWLLKYEECVNYEAIEEPKKRLKDNVPASAAVAAHPKR